MVNKKGFSFSATLDKDGIWTFVDSKGNPINICKPLVNDFKDLDSERKAEFLNAFIFDMYSNMNSSHFMSIRHKYKDIFDSFQAWKNQQNKDYEMGWC